MAVLGAPEHAVQLRCCLLLHGGKHVGIRIEGEVDACVAHPITDDLGMDAMRWQPHGVRMPQIVDAHMG